MKFLAFIVLAATTTWCSTTETIVCFPMECATVATVRDLSGLDGCGFVFELEDGTRLEPERRVYVQPPNAGEDPLYYYELKANEVVQISYQPSPDLSSACMAGDMVFITCIKPYQTTAD